jgi:hypothetical protein
VLSLRHAAGQIISYIEMCQAWSVSFQKGMHYHLRPSLSVLLMSRRQGAPYRDRIEETGRVLVYEGHDVSRSQSCPKPKSLDQPRATPSGKLTQNGLFEQAAIEAKKGKRSPEIVAVYEKIHAGIWAFNGFLGSRAAGENKTELAQFSSFNSNWRRTSTQKPPRPRLFRTRG